MRHLVLLALGCVVFASCAPVPTTEIDSGTALDAGQIDAGQTDAGSHDAGTFDAGHADAGDLRCDGGETFQAARASMLMSCGGFGPMSCHARDPFGGDLDLTEEHAYGSLLNIPATQSIGKTRVIPGDPLNSFLVQKLTNNLTMDEGNPMPQGEGIRWQPPDPAQLKVLECWIARGAPND
jgi:hypothetical protein